MLPNPTFVLLLYSFLQMHPTFIETLRHMGKCLSMAVAVALAVVIAAASDTAYFSLLFGTYRRGEDHLRPAVARCVSSVHARYTRLQPFSSIRSRCHSHSRSRRVGWCFVFPRRRYDLGRCRYEHESSVHVDRLSAHFDSRHDVVFAVCARNGADAVVQGAFFLVGNVLYADDALCFLPFGVCSPTPPSVYLSVCLSCCEHR